MKKKVDVLVIGALPKELGSKNYGGVTRVIWSLAKSFKKANLEFALFGIEKYFGGDQVVEEIPIFGSKLQITTFIRAKWSAIKHLSQFWNISWKNKIRLFYAIYTLCYIRKYFDVKLLHVHHYVNLIPSAAKIIGWDIPIVLTMHGFVDELWIHLDEPSLHPKKEISLINKELSRADYITWVSGDFRKQAEKVAISWTCEDCVVYNGMSFPEDIKSEVKSSEKKVCFVGSFDERKGLLKLMESMKLLDHEIHAMVWIGQGPLQETIIQEMQNASFRNRFLGVLTNLATLGEIEASGVLVAPSIIESFGLVYLEGLVMGTPVIGYHGTMDEFRKLLAKTDYEKEWLQSFDYYQEDEAQLAEKIKRGLLIKTNPEYLMTKEIIRERIRSSFNWSKIALDYIEIFDRFIKEVK